MPIKYLDSKRIVMLSTEIIYNINNADTQQETRSGSTTSNGVQILVNNSGIGTPINKIMFPMKKAGTPPSTFKYEIYNDAGSLQVGTETKTADSLTTSFVDTILTLTAPHTIVVGDRIVVTYASGDTSNKVLVSEDNSVGTIPTNTTHTAYNSGWTQSTSQWSNAKFYHDKPTNVQDNSILVEKDTAERYWFTGGTWFNPLELAGQIAQLSGSDAANQYTAASEFYSIPTDTWGSVFNIASGGRGRGGSAGTPTHCYLLGGQDGSKYYNEVDRIAWADKTQNATTMSGTRAWGNTVSNAVSVCVGQSFYYGSYSNSIDEFTYPTMTSTSQGNTSANFAFSGAFGNSSFGFVAKNATINKYTYSDKSNTNSSLATPPSPPNHAGHTGNSTVGMSINNSSASTNAKYDTYNIAANTWASNTVTSTTSYEDGRASGSTKYNLYSTQTNKSVARSCEKFNYGSGTLTSFTSVTTNLDGADGDAGASSNNTGVTS